MNRLYTEKDLKNAFKVGKTYVSFQYIDGRGAINECYGDTNTVLNFCVDMFAGLLIRTPITTTPEELVDEISTRILDQYYKHKKDIADGKEKYDTRK